MSRFRPTSLHIAERALGFAPKDDAAIAYVARERSLTLRYAGSRPTQATSVDDHTVTIAALHNGQVGRATTNVVDDDDALARTARAAHNAACAAAVAAGAGAYPGFPHCSHPFRSNNAWDAPTAALDPGLGARALAKTFLVGGSAGVEAYGSWRVAETEIAVASTTGTAATTRFTDAFEKTICVDRRGRTGYAAKASRAAADLSSAELAERAARKATFPGDAARLPPGEYPVVLERHAVGLLLELLAAMAFDGRAYADGRGALAGRLGESVAAPAVTLVDLPVAPHTLPRPFDAEGTPKLPLTLLDAGTACAVAHDTRSAAMAGVASTAHALLPGGSPVGPRPTNLVLAGGGAESVEELCGPVDCGLYVTRLWYANVLRSKETLVTAMTRDGTFLIEGGRITRPAEDLRLTDDVLGILARTEELTCDPLLTTDGDYARPQMANGVVCPALRAGAAKFTRCQ